MYWFKSNPSSNNPLYSRHNDRTFLYIELRILTRRTFNIKSIVLCTVCVCVRARVTQSTLDYPATYYPWSWSVQERKLFLHTRQPIKGNFFVVLLSNQFSLLLNRTLRKSSIRMGAKILKWKWYHKPMKTEVSFNSVLQKCKYLFLCGSKRLKKMPYYQCGVGNVM